MLLLSYFGLAAGLGVAATLISVAIRLSSVDRFEAKRGAARSASWFGAIMGRARTRDDWLPDGRIKGGMVYNRSENRIEVCGRLSDEAFDRIFP